ncbi:3-deoxy-D-manno-octulosonic acid transferase [Rubrolithibacter danxiaensis]|uniref:3-deoxy-D-manno-octulosonic acid transferase n=1 Tax=Rubrolithibacter danxiaensis TaxID=3390805 RepID=UPI003BF910B3
MLFVYNFCIKIYLLLIFIFSFFNRKARLWINGRKNIFKIIEKEQITGSTIWFHFASLGEFEQGRPVLEKIKQLYPHKKTFVTFFSPSGYEVRKNFAFADYVFYLPMDSKSNAEKFIKLVNPEIAVFTKYEYWYHYYHELAEKKIPLYVISAIFRKEQPFFKWYGGLHRRILGFVSHFFVQDEKSKQLLDSMEVRKVTISGDTRFDRVFENSQNPQQIQQVEDFCSGSNIFIAGSTWPQDEKLISALTQKNHGWKFIIAPHEIKEEKIISLEESLKVRSVRFSKVKSGAALPSDASVLIIDNIGMLSSLYQYGNIAYIGGGFGSGIHNTLEAAAFGLPVIFGPNYQRFLEAKELIEAGAAFSIRDSEELETVLLKLKDPVIQKEKGLIAKMYVKNHTGATNKIVEKISDGF